MLPALSIFSGVPISLYLWLRQFRSQLDDATKRETDVIAARKRNVELERNPIASIAFHYRPRYWFFEVVSLFRRLLLTSFVLVIPDAASMLIFVLLVSTLLLVIEREANPYLKPDTSMSVCK